MNDKYGLVGLNISHSVSPYIHKKLFAFSGKKADYELFPMTEIGEKEVKFLRTLSGFNVTMPFKETVADICDKDYSGIGSVNTVKVTALRTEGYNTDKAGFIKAVKGKMPWVLKNKTAFVFGLGGAARGVVSALLKEGFSVTVGYKKEHMSKLKKFSEDFKDVRFADIGSVAENYSLFVNATPLGKHIPVGENLNDVDFSRFDSIFDLVYNPYDGFLSSAASKNGISYCDGLPMLVYQAAEAHKIWYGGEFPDLFTEDLIKDLGEKIK